MKFHTIIFTICLCILTACSTTSPNSRIKQDQLLFNSYTAAERRMIRSGQVAIGFDRDMVRMALGDPSHLNINASAMGSSTIWEYHVAEPKLGAFVGATVRNGVDAGVGLRGSPIQSKLLKRVTFDASGKVSHYQSFN